ncbi:MAG: PaaI family thioesterase [Gemmatimonadaceae bacterium]|nr:PaaI family thioesterase [Gemmatimonadaceae bacterium]
MALLTLEQLNALQGWSRAMHLVYTAVSEDEVKCEFEIADQHLQPFGLVHGGVHCGVIETLTSVGALMYAHPMGMLAVGLENHTSFVRATKAGKLFAEARPISRGRTNQLWEAWIRDDKGRIVAQGRVRLQNVTDRGDPAV